MSGIRRTEPGPILSAAVECQGFVYLPAIAARDRTLDVKGQTADVLAHIDELLERQGADRSQLLQALVWVRNMADREAMNEVWSGWLPKDSAPVRGCVQAELGLPDALVQVMVTAFKGSPISVATSD